MENCIFCKIASGEIPCQKIAQNDNFLAFLDINPLTVGHTLVVPKQHFKWTYDVPNFGEYWEFTREVTLKIQTQYKPKFISYLTMGEDVSHAHIHIVPRYGGDTIRLVPKI